MTLLCFLKPTVNGLNCKLPYRVSGICFFCNEGYCPTQTNTRTACLSGQFGHIAILANNYKGTHVLNTPQNGIIGINQQCLLYYDYYYMSILPGTVDKITVRNEETSGRSDTIDTVANSPINGWIKPRTSTVTGTSTTTATESINSSTIKLTTGLTTLSTASIITVVPIIASTKQTNSSTAIITTHGQSRMSPTTSKEISSETVSEKTSATTLPAIESTFSRTLTILDLTTSAIWTTSSATTMMSIDTSMVTETTEKVKTTQPTEETSDIIVFSTPQEITSIEVPRTSETTIKLTITKTFSLVATNHTSLVSVTSSKITIAVPTKISTNTSRESTDLIITTTATRSSTTLIMNATTFGNNKNNVGSSNKPLTIVLATIASTAGSIFGSAAQHVMEKDQNTELSLIVEADPMKNKMMV
ncbi:unnamed protein product [Rotaria magnacalcarata]|uniref:Uncharacterized protein n=2 Tax=Rotaria magnacalcarata TaxID=392030 RepID=A0A8S2JBC7_9BILA|nr:unnamed protein product [Rotaria magnacalcarata]